MAETEAIKPIDGVALNTYKGWEQGVHEIPGPVAILARIYLDKQRNRIHKSQHRNRSTAVSMLEWGLADIGWKDQPIDEG